MLQVIDIHTYYGDSHVLQGISINVEKGSLVAVLGRNGVGKTTLVHSIIGFIPPKGGKVVFKGIDITTKPTHQIVQMGIGLVPQGRRIFPSLSVNENLLIAVKPKMKNGRFNLTEVYRLFPQLKDRAKHRGNELSGGEQQMLAIGRALIGNPELILLDEPSEGLAPLLLEEIGRTIANMKSSGLSMLLIEQNIEMALSLADYVYIVSKGRIVYESVPEQLRYNDEIKMKYLGVGK